MRSNYDPRIDRIYTVFAVGMFLFTLIVLATAH